MVKTALYECFDRTAHIIIQKNDISQVLSLAGRHDPVMLVCFIIKPNQFSDTKDDYIALENKSLVVYIDSVGQGPGALSGKGPVPFDHICLVLAVLVSGTDFNGNYGSVTRKLADHVNLFPVYAHLRTPPCVRIIERLFVSCKGERIIKFYQKSGTLYGDAAFSFLIRKEKLYSFVIGYWYRAPAMGPQLPVPIPA